MSTVYIIASNLKYSECLNQPLQFKKLYFWTNKHYVGICLPNYFTNIRKYCYKKNPILFTGSYFLLVLHTPSYKHFFVRIKKWGNRSQLRFFGWRTKLKSSESSFAFSCLLFVFVRWWMLANHSTYKMSSCTFKTYSLTKRQNCQISKKLWNQYFHEIAIFTKF